MELIERYLQAVGYWLPKTQRADILAELSEDLRSELDSREAELGRKANEDDCVALLKRRGDPYLVAQRFLPERHLIGPGLFPIYLLVLKVYALVWVAPWLVVWLGALVFFPSFRAGHPFQNLQGLGVGSIDLLFFTTLGFAIVERLKLRGKSGAAWDPCRLRPRPDPQRIPRASSVGDFAAGVAFVLWWGSAVGLRTEFAIAGVRIALAPEWRYFVGAILAVSVVGIALAIVNWFRPWWTKLRAGIRLAIDVASSALFCGLLKSAVVAQLVVPNLSEEKALGLVGTLNGGMSRAFPLFAFCGVLIVALDVRRLLRLRASPANKTVAA